MNRIHKLKILESFATDIVTDRKTFEVRKNDRGFQKGDYVEFTCIENENHSINHMTYEITYVLNWWGIEQGYVVFGIKEKEWYRMRLIDADKSIEEYTQIFVEKFGIEGGEMFKGVIKQMPTAYDIDEVIALFDEKLEELDRQEERYYAKGNPKNAAEFSKKISTVFDDKMIVKRGINRN